MSELYQPLRYRYDEAAELLRVLGTVTNQLPAVIELCKQMIVVRNEYQLPIDGGMSVKAIKADGLQKEREVLQALAEYQWTFREINAIQIFEVLIRHLSQNSSFARQHLLASPPAEPPVKTPAA